ncbi:hypothetical protein A8924_2251 [Saccharopolyspora erythraea NRRL 2338]|uniref:Uncharacterized protein n=2 Tax=Saccharopolyspora erythraea TaxID=1836 RepID=A4FAT9_SACEN|nr:hypothetical protein [Saccharopolyspora erythraea]EQD81891.1 hypothetical protein N599_33635 [Saccharopolyspora erythraea D]PFG94946.1 hypothetical protein A8924_2251 [Saccharopolyspora erythraea NRRL 2338]QRK91640.1 hypothetical protein JQX30_09810 [Saccharopolyspora erythraea]CAM01164.1 hypothetical protein SACE_1852 [Saccharopolyspora erythraea NRRL 2338]
MANALVQQAADRSQEIERAVDDFWEVVDELLSRVPDFLSYLVEPIQRGMEALARLLQDFWDRTNQLFEQPGDSDRLREISELWAGAVATPVGDVAGDITLSGLQAGVRWEGPAAEAYKALVPKQEEGLNGVEDVAMQIRQSLNNLANAIDAFWLAVLVALGVFVVGAVTAIATACTVVCTPGAIAAIATAAGVSVGLITTAVVAMNSYLDVIDTEQTDLRDKIRDLGDQWTRSAHDLSDGSVSDGDSSDWRVIR